MACNCKARTEDSTLPIQREIERNGKNCIQYGTHHLVICTVCKTMYSEWDSWSGGIEC